MGSRIRYLIRRGKIKPGSIINRAQFKILKRIDPQLATQVQVKKPKKYGSAPSGIGEKLFRQQTGQTKSRDQIFKELRENAPSGSNVRLTSEGKYVRVGSSDDLRAQQYEKQLTSLTAAQRLNNIFKKQGKQSRVTKDGLVLLREQGRKKLINPTGSRIFIDKDGKRIKITNDVLANVPESARLETKEILEREQRILTGQRRIKKDKEDKEDKEKFSFIPNEILNKLKNQIIRKKIPIVVKQGKEKEYLDNIKRIINGKKITPSKLITTGEIKAIKQDKNILNKIKNRISKEKEIQLTAIQKSNKAEERIFKGIFVLGLLGGVRGVVSTIDAISKPIQTTKAILEAAKNPLKTIKLMGHEFTIDPVGTITEFYTFNKVLGVGSTTLKRSPVGRYVNEELYIRSQPKELRPYVRSIIKSSKAQEVLNPFKVKSIKKVNFFEVKELSKIEATALKKTLKQTDSVIFGSLPARTLSKGKTKIPKDVDIATKSTNIFNKKFIENMPKSQRNNYIIKSEKIIRKSDNTPIVDVKPLNRLYPDKSLFSKKGFLPVSGYVRLIKAPKGSSILPQIKKTPGISALEIPTQKLLNIEGLKLIGFGEQTTRKALGTLQVLIEKNIKRAKDPQAFVESLQIQLEALKKSKPKTIIGRKIKQSKIKNLSNTIKLLTSKKFLSLLEKKTPGITKEYPILKKININKLKKVKKINKKEIQRKIKLPKKTSASRLPKKTFASRKPKPKIIMIDEEKKKGKRDGYIVLVREKGKFLKANKKLLPRNKALNLGSKIVGGSTAASFRIVKKGKTKLKDSRLSGQLSQYRQARSKKLQGSRVEKTKFRINTKGELQGITAKGLIIKMQKGKKIIPKKKKLKKTLNKRKIKNKLL